MRNAGTAVRAFTLLEVVIVIGLLVIIVVGLSSFVFRYSAVYIYETAAVTAASNASAVANEIMNAGIAASQVLTSHTFAEGTFASGGSTVIFELPAIDDLGVIIPNTFDYVVIYATGTSVYRITEADSASARNSGKRLLSDSIESFVLTYDFTSFPQVTKVTFDIHTEVLVKETLIERTLHQQVRLRNIQ